MSEAPENPSPVELLGHAEFLLSLSLRSVAHLCRDVPRYRTGQKGNEDSESADRPYYYFLARLVDAWRWGVGDGTVFNSAGRVAAWVARARLQGPFYATPRRAFPSAVDAARLVLESFFFAVLGRVSLRRALSDLAARMPREDEPEPLVAVPVFLRAGSGNQDTRSVEPGEEEAPEEVPGPLLDAARSLLTVWREMGAGQEWFLDELAAIPFRRRHDLIMAEVTWECARAICEWQWRNPAIPATAPRMASRPRPIPNAERDAWIREERRRGSPLAAIEARLRRMAPERAWKAVTLQRIAVIANEPGAGGE